MQTYKDILLTTSSVEQLRKSREQLILSRNHLSNKDNWGQGLFYVPGNPARTCAVGALAYVSGNTVKETFATIGKKLLDEAALDIKELCIIGLNDKIDFSKSIYNKDNRAVELVFEDTHEQVLDCYDLAISWVEEELVTRQEVPIQKQEEETREPVLV